MAVTRQISKVEKDAGAGKTETDALESAIKFLEERVSLKEQERGRGTGREKKFSFLWPVSFSDQEQGCLHFWALSLCVLWNQQVEEMGDGHL